MGIKRKASVLIEDFNAPPDTLPVHAQPVYNMYTNTTNTGSSPLTSPLPTLSSPSSASTVSEDASSSSLHHHPSSSVSCSPYNFWTRLNDQSIPYLNSRTRKRHRDGRPDDETIHETTLKKLYDAQRLHLDETLLMPTDLDRDLDMDMDMDMGLDLDDNVGMSLDVHNNHYYLYHEHNHRHLIERRHGKMIPDNGNLANGMIGIQHRRKDHGHPPVLVAAAEGGGGPNQTTIDAFFRRKAAV
ncbi:hypothetical protein ABEF93_005057 [Exophiala dermatitidis]